MRTDPGQKSRWEYVPQPDGFTKITFTFTFDGDRQDPLQVHLSALGPLWTGKTIETFLRVKSGPTQHRRSISAGSEQQLGSRD